MGTGDQRVVERHRGPEKASREQDAGVVTARPPAAAGSGPHAWIADLHATVGNRAVTELIGTRSAAGSPPVAMPVVQRAPKGSPAPEAAGGEKPDPNPFPGGLSQVDRGQLLLQVISAANNELAAARDAGYQIPKGLVDIAAEAQDRFDTEQAGWDRGAPKTTSMASSAEAEAFAEFLRDAVDEVNSMASRRAADIARARGQEAEALRAAADRQLADLQVTIADQRRAAFKARDKNLLDKVHEALGHVTSAVNDTKDAAAIVTSRVDQVNAAVAMVGKSGMKAITIPKVPESFSGLADKLVSANEKIGKVIELLDLVTPAGTKLEGGIKYLQAVDLALEKFAGKSANPFISTYVNYYLSPGIKNCVASLRAIANIQSSENRGLIEQGNTDAVQWNVEEGGVAVYGYLLLVRKSGAGAPINDPAWTFFSTRRAELSSAVKDKMPKDRASISAWTAKNWQAVWESFYGSTRPPR
jgi:hypothetical protein